MKDVASARVVLCTNFIPPYRVPLYQELGRRFGALRVSITGHSDGGLHWTAPRSTRLDIQVQRTVALPVRHVRHPHGHRESQYENQLEVSTFVSLARYRPDVVISAELGPRTMQAVAYGMVWRVPVVIWATLSEVTELSRGSLRRFLRPRLLARAARVLVNGASGVRYVQGLGVPPDRIVIVRQPGKRPKETPPPPRVGDEPFRIVVVGQLIERKGVGPFLMSLGHWARSHPERHIEVTLLGDGPLRESLARTSLPPSVMLQVLGAADHATTVSAYAKCHVLALPTFSDEWAQVVNEALANGRPVLGSVHAQAVEELVVEGLNGWVFDPRNPGDVTAAIDRMFSTDDETLAQMSAAAVASVADLTFESQAALITGVVESLL